MSLIRMATMISHVYPAQRMARTVRTPGQAERLPGPTEVRQRRPRPDAIGWRVLLTEAYPAIGLALIVAYLLWATLAGDYALPLAGELLPVE